MTPNAAAVYDWGVFPRVSAGYLCIIYIYTRTFMTMDFWFDLYKRPIQCQLEKYGAIHRMNINHQSAPAEACCRMVIAHVCHVGDKDDDITGAMGK